MAETVNTGAILISDGNGGYSKLFTESMTDIVKLQNGSSLTEKLAEIDGKLPIVLTSGQLPETLNFGQMAVNEDGSFYLGNSENEPVSYSNSSSGVLTVSIEAVQLMMLLDTCVHNQFVPTLPENVYVDLLNVSDSECEILEGNWASLYGAY